MRSLPEAFESRVRHAIPHTIESMALFPLHEPNYSETGLVVSQNLFFQQKI